MNNTSIFQNTVDQPSLMELKYGFTHKYILQISNKTCPPNITHIINIISVINSRANYTIISLPNPPNNQIPAIETTAQSAQLLDIGDGMYIGQRLSSVKRDNNSYLIRFRNGFWAAAVGKIYANLKGINNSSINSTIPTPTQMTSNYKMNPMLPMLPSVKISLFILGTGVEISPNALLLCARYYYEEYPNLPELIATIIRVLHVFVIQIMLLVHQIFLPTKSGPYAQFQYMNIQQQQNKLKQIDNNTITNVNKPQQNLQHLHNQNMSAPSQSMVR